MTVAAGPRVVGQGPEAPARPAHQTRLATPEERAVAGKGLRRRFPLEDHARCDPGEIDAVALLRADDGDRVQELVPIRYGRMLTSPFAFYRGSASVMAADLARLPASGLTTQLCGDAHIANFGVFKSPERRLVFDINDFDETLPGPFEWDVKRLAASLALAGRENGHSAEERTATQVAATGAYRRAMRAFATQGNLAVWYAGIDIERALADLAPRAGEAARRRAKTNVARAGRRDSTHALRKLTVTEDGSTRFLHEPPLLVPLQELLPAVDAAVVRTSLLGIVAAYRETLPTDRRHLLDQYELVDVARKVVGVGSVGTRAWVLLLSGRDSGDPLVLQAKEAGPSALEAYLGKSGFDNAGERVVSGQRLMQASSDIFLGWQRTIEGDGRAHDYYIRQLKDGKASAEIQEMDPRVLTLYGELCARTLARAHARTGDRIVMASYLGKRDTFDRAVATFAEAYAERAESMFVQLREAVEQGTVPATTGV